MILAAYRLGLVIACVVLALLSGRFPSAAPALLLLLAAIGFFLIRRKEIPSAAMWVFTLAPVGYMDVTRVIGRYFTPTVILLLIWQIRLLISRPRRPIKRPSDLALLFLSVLLLALLVSAFNGYSLFTSSAWIGVFVLCVLLPVFIGQYRPDDVSSELQNTLAWIGIFLGLLSAVEFFLQVNPWLDLYKIDVTDKTWSVFRTRSSLGHPLVSAVLACICLVNCLFNRSIISRTLVISSSIASSVAIVLTVSRTAIIAIAVAILFGILTNMVAGSNALRRKSLLLIFVGGLAVMSLLFSPLMTERASSTGGEKSAIYRLDGYFNALTMFKERPYLGFGPGNSADVYASYYEGLLETSALQILVSIGVVGSTLILLGLTFILGICLKKGLSSTIASVVAYIVGIAGFSAIDTNPGILALLCPFIYLAFSSKPNFEPAASSSS
jgi:O-antigen ligase